MKNTEGKIGNTPLVRLEKIERDYGLVAELYAKAEFHNPTGSVKDRASLYMIESAERAGLLKEGGTVIEPTSGNTGIGLAFVCKNKGYRAIIVMPDNMSEERQAMMKAYGAEVVLTDGKLGMRGAIARAYELQSEIAGAFIPNQFENPANAQAHYETTGREIDAQTGGKVDIFVATVGTGGTFTGTARYLKERNVRLQAVAVEPKGSPVLSGGKAGAHAIQGIGAGFIPEVMDVSLMDEVIAVSDGDALSYAREVFQREGLYVGISSGAAVCAAVEVAKRKENAGKKIVLVLPDDGNRYGSVFKEL